LLGENAIIGQLTGEAGQRFDIRQFGAIGAPSGSDADVCVFSARSGLDAVRWRAAAAPLRMGVTARGSGPYARTILLAAALRLPVRLIIGYQGTSQIRLAVDSGEVDGICTTLSSYRGGFEPKANYAAALQHGGNGSPDLVGVPSADALVQDDTGRSLLAIAATIRSLARFIAVPPGVPAEVTEQLRTAFAETMRDPAFLRAAADARLEIEPLSAEDVTARVNAVLDLAPDARQRIRALLAKSQLPE
jgi:hypothetical protein